MHRILALLVTGLLVLGASACGGGEAADPAASSGPAASAAPSGSAAAPGTETASGSEAAAVDLPDGVAARVDGEDIPAAETDERAQALLEAATSSDTPPEGDPEALLDQARAQILSMSIQSRILATTAEEEGVAVTDADIDQARSELAAEAGGEDQLAEATGANGISDEALDEQLRGQAALTNLLDAFAPSEAPSGAPPASGAPESQAPASAAPGSETPEGELASEPGLDAVQALIAERLAATDVVVDEQYGTWQPAQAQVIPPGMQLPPPGATGQAPPPGAPGQAPVPPPVAPGGPSTAPSG